MIRFVFNMIFKLAMVLTLIAMGLAAYTSFCRPCIYPPTQISAPAIDSPEAARSLIYSSEARIKDLRPGMSKEIIWFANENEKTRYSIVYIHGFSASKEEIRPVPDILAKTFKANLFYTRLTGHGQLSGALGDATINDWLNDTLEAANIGRAIGNKVILVGTSTGASLITWLAAKPEYANDIAAVVFVSPNYGLQSKASHALRLPFAKTILPKLFGPTRGFTPANYEHAIWWTPDYPTQALVPMAQAIDLAVTAPIKHVNVPAYFVFSTGDQVVDGKKTLKIIAKWGGPTGHILVDTKDNPGNHVPAGHVLSPSTTQMVTKSITTWLNATLQP